MRKKAGKSKTLQRRKETLEHREIREKLVSDATTNALLKIKLLHKKYGLTATHIQLSSHYISKWFKYNFTTEALKKLTADVVEELIVENAINYFIKKKKKAEDLIKR